MVRPLLPLTCGSSRLVLMILLLIWKVYTCIPFFLQDFVRECIRLDRHIDEEEFIIYRKGGKSAENVEFLESSKKGGKAAKRITDESWAVVATTKLMLAEKWRERISPTGYWISEKLDGVRAFWSGKAFYSRRGNQFPAPDWFKAKMPQNVELDGELWCGRRMFRRSLAIVRNAGSDKLWQYVTYQVFDLPSFKNSKKEVVAATTLFEDRLKRIREITKNNDVCVAVGMLRCESTAHLRSELKKVVGRGGEGLMLRKPKSDYVQGRSDVLLKVKNFQDEEAKVMRYQDGKGKHVGKVGALALRTPDGREFLCGSGMTDKDRESPPKIGAVVTYRFPELMNNGYPRHPVFVAPRPDFDWLLFQVAVAAADND